VKFDETTCLWGKKNNFSHHKYIPLVEKTPECLSLTAVGRWRSPDSARTVVHAESLEAVPQSLHVGIFVALELEAGGDDLRGPGDTGGFVVGFEHEVEVAGVGGVDGEVVRAVPRVGLGVGGEPCLCKLSVSGSS
jgi:hypothetical protein